MNRLLRFIMCVVLAVRYMPDRFFYEIGLMVNDRLRMSLLPALQAILENASVTRAAETMHVTQSTMSRTLGQLRGILNDPILIREGNHIFLSEKARKLQPLVDRLVADADQLFESQVFAPATSKHHFRIMANSIFQELFLVNALAEIKYDAPGMTFSISSNSNQSLQDMENGEIDLGFLQFTDNTPDWLRGITIGRDTLYIVFRKSHPLVNRTISDLSELDDYPYVGAQSPMHEDAIGVRFKSQCSSLQQPWMMLQSLQAVRAALRVSNAYTISNYFSCPELWGESEFVMQKVPFVLPETLFKMVWPEHWEFSTAHQWLRKRLEKSLQQFYVDANMTDLC